VLSACWLAGSEHLFGQKIICCNGAVIEVHDGALISGMRFNKPLYSFSYVCFMGGAAGLVLTGFYLLVLSLSSLVYPCKSEKALLFLCPVKENQKHMSNSVFEIAGHYCDNLNLG
jgi:hypothetical protein